MHQLPSRLPAAVFCTTSPPLVYIPLDERPNHTPPYRGLSVQGIPEVWSTLWLLGVVLHTTVQHSTHLVNHWCPVVGSHQDCNHTPPNRGLSALMLLHEGPHTVPHARHYHCVTPMHRESKLSFTYPSNNYHTSPTLHPQGVWGLLVVVFASRLWAMIQGASVCWICGGGPGPLWGWSPC